MGEFAGFDRDINPIHKKIILKILEPDAYKQYKILEIGSYPYTFTKQLKMYFNDVTELDKCQGLKVDIEKDEIPAIDNTFDVVVFTDVIEHLTQDPIHALKEIERVLKPKGRVFMTTPNFNYLSSYLKAVTFRGTTNPINVFKNSVLKHGWHGHIREYTKDEIKLLIAETNLKIERAQYLYVPTKEKGLSILTNTIQRLVPIFRLKLYFILRK